MPFSSEPHVHTAPASAEDVLKLYGLRVTEGRLQVLEAFRQRPYALSHGEVEALLPQADRVTLYRTLATFVEKGLLHRVLDDAGAAKYALCSEACGAHAHRDDHAHFKCMRCGRTECLAGVALPALALPSGYRAQEASLLVQGLCREC